MYNRGGGDKISKQTKKHLLQLKFNVHFYYFTFVEKLPAQLFLIPRTYCATYVWKWFGM